AFVILVARTATGFDGNIGRFLSNSGLVFAGRISYGLYIYHIMVAMIFDRWLPSQMRFLITIPSLRLVVFGIVTLFTAALSWRLLEQPINRLGRGKNEKGAISYGSWEELTRAKTSTRFAIGGRIATRRGKAAEEELTGLQS